MHEDDWLDAWWEDRVSGPYGGGEEPDAWDAPDEWVDDDDEWVDDDDE